MEWKTSQEPVPYEEAVALMEARAEAIARGEADELVWFVEHPPLYTAGTSARAEDLLDDARFPVYETGRGGQYTYHGPGQRVVYVMLDLRQRAGNSPPDLRRYVVQLETWIIRTLAQFGIVGEVRDGRVGVWVEVPGGEAKIAALGVRVRRGVSYHGIALNVSPDLEHYSGIVPCGIREYGVTSLAALGREVTMADVDAVLKQEFIALFDTDGAAEAKAV